MLWGETMPARAPGRWRRWAGILTLAGLLAGCAPSHRAELREEAPLSPAQAERLALFDDVAERIGESTAPLVADEVNWAAIVARYRPSAAAATSQDQLYEIIDRMLRELGISHTQVVAPHGAANARAQAEAATDAIPQPLAPGPPAQDAAPASAAPQPGDPPPASAHAQDDASPRAGGPGNAGLDFRWVGDRLVVRSVSEGGPAAAAGLVAGMTVLRVNEVKVEKAWPEAYLYAARPAEAGLLVRQTFLKACQGPAGSQVEVDVLDERGERRAYHFPRELNTARVMSFGNLTVEGEVEVKELEGGVGYVRWNVFMMDLMPELEKAIRDFKGAPGLILDLRGNPGGVVGMSQAVGGMLTDKLMTLGVMESPGVRLQFPVFPKYGAYLGPVAILVDGTSASTSEIFAAGLQETGRAVVIGEPSPGMVLPSVIVELADGGLLQYPTALYKTPKGRVLEGGGVTPNVAIKPDPDAWALGRDPTVEAAHKVVLGLAGTRGDGP